MSLISKIDLLNVYFGLYELNVFMNMRVSFIHSICWFEKLNQNKSNNIYQYFWFIFLNYGEYYVKHEKKISFNKTVVDQSINEFTSFSCFQRLNKVLSYILTKIINNQKANKYTIDQMQTLLLFMNIDIA